MKITKKVQREDSIQIDIETPSYFKIIGYHQTKFYQVVSEYDITEVNLDISYTTTRRMPMEYYHEYEKIFEGEAVTHAEFNTAFSEAISKLSQEVSIESIALETV